MSQIDNNPPNQYAVNVGNVFSEVGLWCRIALGGGTLVLLGFGVGTLVPLCDGFHFLRG